MRTRVRFVTVLAAGLAVGLVAMPAIARDLARLRENREARWSAMPEGQRDVLRDRYDRFLELTPRDREMVERHSNRLLEVEERLVGRLETPDLESLEALPDEKRREVLDEMVVAEARTTAQRILRKLPADIRERLRNATPVDRALFLQQYKAEESARIEKAYQHLTSAVGLDAHQIATLQQLGPERRRQVFVELAAVRIRDKITEQGVPEGLAREVWPRVQAMEPLEFLEAVVWLRELHPDFGGLERVSGAGDRLVHRKDQISRLKGALVISDRDRIRLAELPRGERKLRLEQLQRKRATRVVREESLVGPAQLAQLEDLPSREFFYQVRNLIMDKPVGGSLGAEMFPAGAGPPGQAPDPGTSPVDGSDG